MWPLRRFRAPRLVVWACVFLQVYLKQTKAVDINFDTKGKPKISIRDPETNAVDDFIGPFLGTIRAEVDIPPGVDSIQLPLIFWAIDSW